MLYVNPRVLPAVKVRSINVLLAPIALDRRTLVYCLPSVFTEMGWQWVRLEADCELSKLHLLAVLPSHVPGPRVQLVHHPEKYEMARQWIAEDVFDCAVPKNGGTASLPVLDFETEGHGIVRLAPVSLMSN